MKIVICDCSITYSVEERGACTTDFTDELLNATGIEQCILIHDVSCNESCSNAEIVQRNAIKQFCDGYLNSLIVFEIGTTDSETVVNSKDYRERQAVESIFLNSAGFKSVTRFFNYFGKKQYLYWNSIAAGVESVLEVFFIGNFMHEVVDYEANAEIFIRELKKDPVTFKKLYELLKKNCDTDGVKAVDAF